MGTFILLVIASYLLGSVPNAYLITQAVKKVDIRTQGSGNVGASNVFRVVGKKWGLAVFVLDVFKGWLPAALVPLIWNPETLHGWNTPKMTGLYLGMISVLGHNWPIWLKFKGGKGVATSLGVFLALTPQAALGSCAVWLLAVWISNYIALGSIAASAAFVGLVAWFYRDIPEFPLLISIAALLALLIVYMHRSNIRRLRQGTEHPAFKRHR